MFLGGLVCLFCPFASDRFFYIHGIVVRLCVPVLFFVDLFAFGY